MSKIILHQYEVSPFCQKARRILNAKGVAFETHEVTASAAPLAIRKINKVGKLPVLDYDGELTADSTEIARFLEERHPDPPLFPENPGERALCHVLEDWADESLYFYEMTMRFAWSNNSTRWARETVKHDNALMRAVGPAVVPRMLTRRASTQGVARKPPELVRAEVGRHFDALEVFLADGDWLVGDAMTLADIAVASQVDAIRGAEEGRAELEARPLVGAWLERTDALTLST